MDVVTCGNSTVRYCTPKMLSLSHEMTPAEHEDDKVSTFALMGCDVMRVVYGAFEFWCSVKLTCSPSESSPRLIFHLPGGIWQLPRTAMEATAARPFPCTVYIALEDKWCGVPGGGVAADPGD